MNFYKVLKVEQNATPKEIQKSFQNQSLILHPDKNPSTSSEFQVLLQAYETLKDETLRKEYDSRINTKMGALQEVVNLDDMEYNNREYSKICRCGGQFIVTEIELESGVYGIECNKCSLCVQLLYSEIVD